jgi:hypothetical protein
MSVLQVIPGYSGLNARQRKCLLDLHEQGELKSPVFVGAGRAAPARDRDGKQLILYSDGSHSWTDTE